MKRIVRWLMSRSPIQREKEAEAIAFCVWLHSSILNGELKRDEMKVGDAYQIFRTHKGYEPARNWAKLIQNEKRHH